jgi:hypothetical protein
MLSKALTFIHSLARKSLTKGQGSGITKIPSAMQAEAKASEIFTNLVEAGLKPEMMDDFIKSEADVAKYLNIIDAYKRERMKPIPADSPRGKEITEALFGKRGTVVDMKGKVIPKESGIMGGESIESLMKSGDVTKGTVTKKSKKVTDRDMFRAANENYITDTISKIKSMDPIEAMKEANKVIKREGPYKNLNQQQAKKILEDTEDHIFERDVTPMDEDFAAGGVAGLLGERTGYAQGTDVFRRQKKEIPEEIKKKIFEMIMGTRNLGKVIENSERTKSRIGSEGVKAYGLAEGGRTGYKEGLTAKQFKRQETENLAAKINEYFDIKGSGSISGKNQIMDAPDGITANTETFNAIINMDIPIIEKINLLGSFGFGKDRFKVEKGDEELFLGEGGYKDRNIGLGFNQGGEGLSGSVIRNLETGDNDYQVKFLKKFASGGRVGLRYGGDTMGGINDKSVSSPGPDRSKVSAQQERNNQAAVREAQAFNQKKEETIKSVGSGALTAGSLFPRYIDNFQYAAPPGTNINKLRNLARQTASDKSIIDLLKNVYNDPDKFDPDFKRGSQIKASYPQYVKEGILSATGFKPTSQIGGGTNAARALLEKIGSIPGAQTLGRVLPGVGTVSGIYDVGSRLSKGDYFGAGLGALSAIPFVGIPAAAAQAAYDYREPLIEKSTNFFNKLQGAGQYQTGGRVGLRYGGDTMGGINDKSISSPGPDRSKVSEQQERSHQEAISRARDSQQYDYTVPKQIAKDIAINTGKNLAGQKIASALGIGTGPIGILIALKGLYDQTKNPVYSEEDVTYGFPYQTGGRVGLAGGMTRRAFLKLMGGVAAGIGAIKSGIMGVGKKGVAKKVVKEVIKTPPVAGKPEWFDALINKVILEGDDVTKKLATKDREIVHTKKLNDQESVTVTQDLDDGAIRVEYDSPDNLGQEPVMMQFKPGRADETTGGKKPADRFDVVETEPRYVGPDNTDIEFIGESGGPNISFIESDVTNLKTFATGKGPTMKEIVKSKKRKDLTRAVNENDYEAAEYLGGKYGDAPEPDFPDDYSGYASGGLAYMLGE